MSILATDKKQITIIYAEDSPMGQKILPYAKSSKKPVRSINITKEPIADSIWAEIAKMLNVRIGELFSNDYLTEHDLGDPNNFSSTDWLKIIKNNPSLLQYPIAINGKKAEIVNDRFDFYQFFDADGSNFNKNPEAIKNAKHEDTTGNEDFKTTIKNDEERS
ncbi:MAG TPA: hypothetical protein VJ970_01695 [Flavobacteriaceae bacterium]|nr:hypothetical protein [Flavobacteriaceae bacterium]